MATMANYDYDAQQADIARREKMLQMMQMQTMQPQTMPAVAGGVTPRMSIIQAMLPAVMAYFGKGQQDVLSKDKEKLSSRYKEDLVQGMQNYMKTSQGYDMTNPMQGPMPDSSAMTGEHTTHMPGDPKQAIFDALASNHPMVQQMGMEQLKEMGKAKVGLTSKDLLPYSSPKSILENPDNPALWKPKSDLRNVGDIVYDPDTQEVVKLGGPQPTTKLMGVPGQAPDLFQQSPSTGEVKKLDQAPKISLHNTVNTGDNAFMKKVGENTGDMVTNAQKAKQTGQRTNYAADRLEALNNQGVFSGPTANASVTLGQFANTLGLPVDKSKLGRSEEYNAVLSQQISTYLTAGSGVGRSLTDADRQVLERQFPQLISTPQGRQQIIQMLRKSANNDISYANQVGENLRKNYPEAYKLFNVAPSEVEYPAAPGADASKPTVSNW